MATPFWAIDAAKRRRKDPVPGTSKWVSNELYTLNSTVLASTEKFAHNMSDDYDMLNDFMKSVIDGHAVRDFLDAHKQPIAPAPQPQHRQHQLDWLPGVPVAGTGSLRTASSATLLGIPEAAKSNNLSMQQPGHGESRAEDDDDLTSGTVVRRPDGFRTLQLQFTIGAVEPAGSSAVPASPAVDVRPVEPAIEPPVPITQPIKLSKEKESKNRELKYTSEIITHETIEKLDPVAARSFAGVGMTSSPNPASPSNFTFIQVVPDDFDEDDSFQAIRTNIRKSLAGKTQQSPKTPGPHATSTGTVVQSGRKSGFVSLPSREPLVLGMDQKQSERRRTTRKSEPAERYGHTDIELRRVTSVQQAPTTTTMQDVVAVPKRQPFQEKIQKQEPKAAIMDEAFQAIQPRKLDELPFVAASSAQQVPTNPHQPHENDPLKFQSLYPTDAQQQASSTIEYTSTKSTSTTSYSHQDLHIEDTQPNKHEKTALETKKRGQERKLEQKFSTIVTHTNTKYVASAARTNVKEVTERQRKSTSAPRLDVGYQSGSAVHRARNLFFNSSDLASRKHDLALPHQSMKRSLTSVAKGSRSPTISDLGRSRSRSRSPVKPPKLESSPSSSPERIRAVQMDSSRQSELVNRLMAPTSSSAAKRSRPRPELKKNDVALNNRLHMVHLNPKKPVVLSPKKDTYGTLRQQVSSKPIKSPVKRIDIDLETNSGSGSTFETRETFHRNGTGSRPANTATKQKLYATNHGKLPQLKSSLHREGDHMEIRVEKSRFTLSSTQLLLQQHQPSTTPGRKTPSKPYHSILEKKASRISNAPPKSTSAAGSSEFNNPYKTPGRSNKSLMGPKDLPDILTDEEDNKEKRVFETWAESPQLKKVLLQQKNLNPDSIFGSIPPLDIHDIFESQASRQRGRPSLSNWSPDPKTQ